MVRLSVKVTFEGMEYEGTYLIIRTFEVPSYSMYLRTFEGTNEGTFVYLRFIRLLIGRELDHLQKS